MKGRLTTVLVLWALASVGCGKGVKLPPMAKVDGKVLYDGKPVPAGTVSFFPVEATAGSDRGAIGELASDGSFELTTFDTGDGAVLGQHKAVVVVKSEGDTKVPEGTIPSQLPEDIKKTQGLKGLIPARYMDAEKTPLRYTVRPGGNHFTIELKD